MYIIYTCTCIIANIQISTKFFANSKNGSRKIAPWKIATNPNPNSNLNHIPGGWGDFVGVQSYEGGGNFPVTMKIDWNFF